MRLAEASDSSSSDTTAVGAASGLALLDEVWEREELERHSSDSLEACESVEQLLVSLASMCRTSFVDAFSQVEGIVSEARLREEEELILERLLLDGEATDAEPLRQRRANRTNLAAVCFLLASLRHASRRGIAVGKQVSQVDLQRLVEKSLEPALADVDGARPSLSLRDQDTHEPCDSPSLARRPSLIEGALAYLARELAGECGIALAMPHCAKLAEQDLERILRSSKNGSATSVAAKGKQPDLAARLQSTPGRKRVTEVDGREQRLSVVSLRLFGAFACKVFTQEGAVDVRLRDKARTFITLLAMKHGREVSRDWISRVMWPGERCNGPKHVSLNSMWSTVTRALGGKGGNVFAMTKNRNAVVMNDDWTVSDLAELEKLCALVEGGHDLDRRELLFAIKDLYRGELLPGCRNEEVVACRKAWKRRVCEVLASVAQELVSSGEHDLALSYLDFAQQVDPLSEKVCWLQSNALCHVKQYFAAMDAIIEYRKQTREHYATEGSARLNELYERLLTEAE